MTRLCRLVAPGLAVLLSLAVTLSPAAAADPPSVVAGGTWTKLATAGVGPQNRSKPAVAAVGSAAYVFGGVEDDFATFTNTFFNDLHRFDTLTNTWTELSPAGPLPPARAFAAATSRPTAGEVVIYGGSFFDPTFTTFQVFGDLWVYSLADDGWNEVQPINAGPGPRNGATLWADGDRLYLFGGITPFFLFTNDLWEYDFVTNRWTELIPLFAPGSPPGRDEAYAGDHPKQGRLTIYGGESLDLQTFDFITLEDVWQLDLATLTWTEVTPGPAQDVPVHGNLGAASVIGNKLYVQGGDVPGGTAGCGAPFPQNATEELWQFHLVQHRWRQRLPDGDPLTRLKRHAGVTIDDKLYVFGGFDFDCPTGVGDGQIWNNDVYVFDPDA